MSSQPDARAKLRERVAFLASPSQSSSSEEEERSNPLRPAAGGFQNPLLPQHHHRQPQSSSQQHPSSLPQAPPSPGRLPQHAQPPPSPGRAPPQAQPSPSLSAAFGAAGAPQSVTTSRSDGTQPPSPQPARSGIQNNEKAARSPYPPRAQNMRHAATNSNRTSDGSTHTIVAASMSSSASRKPWSRQSINPYNTVGSVHSYAESLRSQGIKDDGLTYDDHDHDPSRWHLNAAEMDDELHDPDVPIHKSWIGWRGILNVGTLAMLILGVLMLFMGYPILTEFYFERVGNKGGYGLGGTNRTGQIPDLASLKMRQDLIDLDTPPEGMKKRGLGRNRKDTWNLVFSDESETEGRSFYAGDDPFWEGHDLYAHGTGDYEWYDPAALMTQNGSLVITFSKQRLHDLDYRSGQVTSWNKFCFTGGYLEARVMLPGSPDVSGWWPAIWTMGNLGRANYGATTEGTWPYTYDACDIGTLINQTNPDGLGPQAAITSGLESQFNYRYHSSMVSWQPGQKLSSCTCPGEDHPGPVLSDGSFPGRSAPEIDLFEAQVNSGVGSLSLSTQFMPTSAGYHMVNKTGTEWQLSDDINGKPVWLNGYKGNVLQMAASAVALTDTRTYQLTDREYSIWGVEYEPGTSGYVTWWIDGQVAWHIDAAAVGPDPVAGISQRPIPHEPMYIIMNLALSADFGHVDWDQLTFPATMMVDYLRLYQPPDRINVGCDPPDYPTTDYINRHMEAYTNPNLTIWGGHRENAGYGGIWPRNRLYNNGQGCEEEPRNYPGRFRPLGETQAPWQTVPPRYSGLTGQAADDYAAAYGADPTATTTTTTITTTTTTKPNDDSGDDTS